MPLASQMNETYTYTDYLSWPDDERWEIINGTAYNMSPAPSRKHQEVATEVIRQLGNYFIDKSCSVYSAPFDVRFSELDVVQPDVSVVCDSTKLDERGCDGAPDLIVEILSPATASKDLKGKYTLYESHGVKQYWIIHPAEQTILIFKLENSQYTAPERYTFEDSIECTLFDGLTICLETLLEKQ